MAGIWAKSSEVRAVTSNDSSQAGAPSVGIYLAAGGRPVRCEGILSQQTVSDDIQSLASAEHVEEQSAILVDRWTAAGAGLEAVEPILRFMEAHPDFDYGPPGALVHFMEQFYGNGYEEEVKASVGRRPTPHTVWMLNRLVNGAETGEMRAVYLSVLRQARRHTMTDEHTLREIDGFRHQQQGSRNEDRQSSLGEP